MYGDIDEVASLGNVDKKPQQFVWEFDYQTLQGKQTEVGCGREIFGSEFRPQNHLRVGAACSLEMQTGESSLLV